MAEKLRFRQRLARWIAGRTTPVRQVRMYASARGSRAALGFGQSTGSADAELASSLTQLRARSRQMVRDNPYAKRAKTLIVNNVIGPGVGMQAQVMNTRGKAAKRVNDEIEWLWWEWCEAKNCHTGGKLHFADIERMAFGEIFEAGEVLIRTHFTSFGGSRVPLSLEVIEAERLASELDVISAPSGNEVRMGVEIDKFGRPVAYYLRLKHPGDRKFGGGVNESFERVPASDMFHLHLVDRWPQTRGEPWMHSVLSKLDLMNEYSAAEVQAARDSAFYFATVKSAPNPDGPNPLGDDPKEDEAPTYNIEPGMVQHLLPGEELQFHTPNRPNTAIDAFLRYMLREVAAGVGPSYAALSQDYSQSNYSSSRLSLLDDRDCWRVLQAWWLRSFREPLHRLFMLQAVLAGALSSVPVEQYGANRRKFDAVLFKPRGWSWVDPTKEVEAYKEAVRAGFMTVTDVIAATAGGQDIEDVLATRKRELEMMAEAGVTVDTTVIPEPEVRPPDPPDDDEKRDDQRLFSLHDARKERWAHESTSLVKDLADSSLNALGSNVAAAVTAIGSAVAIAEQSVRSVEKVSGLAMQSLADASEARASTGRALSEISRAVDSEVSALSDSMNRLGEVVRDGTACATAEIRQLSEQIRSLPEKLDRAVATGQPDCTTTPANGSDGSPQSTKPEAGGVQHGTASATAEAA